MWVVSGLFPTLDSNFCTTPNSISPSYHLPAKLLTNFSQMLIKCFQILSKFGQTVAKCFTNSTSLIDLVVEFDFDLSQLEKHVANILSIFSRRGGLGEPKPSEQPTGRLPPASPRPVRRPSRGRASPGGGISWPGRPPGGWEGEGQIRPYLAAIKTCVWQISDFLINCKTILEIFVARKKKSRYFHYFDSF